MSRVVLQAIALTALSFCAVFGGCSNPNGVPPIVATMNENGSLTDAAAKTLPANPLQWKIITAAVDTSSKTMATLYGNDVAVRFARSNASHDYPVNATIALVTWTQRDDPRYFGAKIPDRLQSIEYVFVRQTNDAASAAASVAKQYSYQKFEGSPLIKNATEEGKTPSPRAAVLLGQRAAVLP
jgi:hypothetical protein